MSKTFGFYLNTLFAEKVPPFAEKDTVRRCSSQSAYKSMVSVPAGIARLELAVTSSPAPFAWVV